MNRVASSHGSVQTAAMAETEDEFSDSVRARFADHATTMDAFHPFRAWPGDAKYLTFLVKVPVPSLAHGSRRLAAALSHVREVDEHGLHMTIQEVGFANEPPDLDP